MKQKIVMISALFAFVSLAAVGCYGPFNLTRRVHKWNGQAGDKWVREVVFLALVILPVYEFASLGDAIVFNSIEFWTGKNPVESASADKELRNIAVGSDKAVMSYSKLSQAVEIRMRGDGKDARTLSLEPQADGSMAAIDQNGKIMMLSQMASDGGIVIENSKGSLIAKYSSEEADKILK